MVYRPVFNKPEDEISKRVEDKIKVELDNRIKTEVDKRVLDVLKEREEKEKTDKASKLAKAVDVAKTLKGETEEAGKLAKAITDKDKAIAEKDMLCPTCHTEGRNGHIHKVDTDKSGLVYKCHDGKCGFEAVMVSKQADYKCNGCGMAIKKPEDPSAMEGCPFCLGSKAIRFDWSKLWNTKKK